MVPNRFLKNKKLLYTGVLLVSSALIITALVIDYCSPGLFRVWIGHGQPNNITIKNIRIQLLSKSLVRIEEKGKNGFEDRNTFTIINRQWPGVPYKLTRNSNTTTISTKYYKINIPGSGETAKDISIESSRGDVFYKISGEIPDFLYLPDPGNKINAWTMPDSPRIIPPLWGATPAPESYSRDPYSGWDADNDRFDVYVFLPGERGYRQLVDDFIKLTGPIPVPPLYAFGLWNSRYYPYNEETAIKIIQTYRHKNIPLDVFVMDTDWRLGSGKGYAINKKLFPDMERFVNQVHDNHVRLVFNDHPEAIGETALAPEELQYRYDNLTSLLKLGVDAWWYDRNWHAHLKVPAPGLREEVWGMRLYHDIIQRFNPELRPLLLSNVDGIDHGYWSYPSHPASHRYPIWWTGDTKANWEYLQKGIANAVNSGISRLQPYVSEDIGGHYGEPTPEFYVRSVQYGVFSPILRLHSSGSSRYPWDFGAEAEKIAAEYIRLRYRLLPTIYSAAYRAYLDSTPILRRCDFYWPEFEEAHNDQQYLFGDDLLIAPVNDGKGLHIISKDLLHTIGGQSGFKAEYFPNIELQGEPVLTRIDKNVDFNWKEGKPADDLPNDNFSVRWTTELGPIPKDGEYEIGVISDDGIRLWFDDELLIDHWRDQAADLQTGRIKLHKGQIYNVRLEYYERLYSASCKLVWWNLDDHSEQTRKVWIPPGIWQDLWTDERVAGPKLISISSTLRHLPLYVRSGGLVLSIPQIQYTGSEPWSVVVVDAFIPEDEGKTTRILYEDDGISPSYQKGSFSHTEVELERKENLVALQLDRMKGKFEGSIKKRTWIVRFHCSKGQIPRYVLINGRKLAVSDHNDIDVRREYVRLLMPDAAEKRMPFMGQGASPGPDAGNIVEVMVPDYNVQKKLNLKINLKNIGM